ncbi:MAG: hypothetical protein JW795_23605 [Chitinivibrionales bacterium]|nr:hypothetical protein [Chitinivibrionales bacterium]
MTILSSMLSDHTFWGALVLASLIWYSTITLYVAIKGVGDIRKMLQRLAEMKSMKEQ